MCFVFFSKTDLLTRSLIYDVHKFGVSQDTNGWNEQSLEHCIVTIVYLDLLLSLFSSKY